MTKLYTSTMYQCIDMYIVVRYTQYNYSIHAMWPTEQYVRVKLRSVKGIEFI